MNDIKIEVLGKMAAGRKCRQHDKSLHVVMYSKINIVLDLYVGFGRIINTY